MGDLRHISRAGAWIGVGIAVAKVIEVTNDPWSMMLFMLVMFAY